MKNWTAVFCLILIAGFACGTQASEIVPVSYVAPPGEVGWYTYYDDTGSQLTDGLHGSPWPNEPGWTGDDPYPWVAWDSHPVTLIFEMPVTTALSHVDLYTGRSVSPSIYIPRSVTIAVAGASGVWTTAAVQQYDDSQFADGTRHTLTIALNSVQASRVKIDLVPTARWIFLDEVDFLGTRPLPITQRLSVPATTPDGVWSSPLFSGWTYAVLASGTCNTHPDRQSDAEWCDDLYAGGWAEYPTGCSTDRDLLDLFVNNQCVNWLGTTDGVNWTPHTFSPSHVYRYYLEGTGSPVKFHIADPTPLLDENWYTDNSGYLNIEIIPIQGDFPSSTIGASKSLQDGSAVYIEDAVVVSQVGLIPDSVFIESSDRSSGIRLLTNETLNVGDRVKLKGIVRRVDGEWQIDWSQIAEKTAGEPLTPLGLNSKSLGNDRTETLNYLGINTTGLLVRMCGKVTAVLPGENVIYVDDGAAHQDGLGPFIGIRVQLPPGVTPPSKGTRVVVTGISRVEKRTLTAWGDVNGNWYPAGTVVYVPSIWVRDSSDIRTL